MDAFLALLVNTVTMGSLYALIAISANLTYRAVRSVNFAHGPMMLVTALLTASLTRAGPLATLPAHIAAPLAALICLAFLIVVLVLAEAFIARPALRVGGMLGWVFATLGIGIALQGAAIVAWGSGAVAFPDVVFTAQSYLPVFGLQIPLRAIAIPAIAIAALVLTETLRRTTLWGQAMRAASMNADLAALQGIPVPRVALLACTASAGLAGLSGLLMAQISSPIGQSFGLRLMMLGFVAAVIGGLGSTAGAILGGLLVGLADALIGGSLAPSAGDAVLLVLLIVVLIRRPHGLFGHTEIVRL